MFRNILISALLFSFVNAQKVTFITDSDVLKNWRVIMSALIKEGYSYNLDSFIASDESAQIAITIKEDKKYNYKTLSKELELSGIYTKDRYSEDGIEYISVDGTRARLQLEALELDSTNTINRSNSSQWFKIPHGGTKLRVEAPYSSHWFALVAFYDVSLKPLDSIRLKESKQSLELEIPQGTLYFKFSNLYGMKMLKEPATVEILR